MLANKYHWEEDNRAPKNVKTTLWNRILQFNPEDVVENMTGFMFKGILIFGIPYFLFVLIRFMMIH
jgi:hypothetical protein